MLRIFQIPPAAVPNQKRLLHRYWWKIQVSDFLSQQRLLRCHVSGPGTLRYRNRIVYLRNVLTQHTNPWRDFAEKKLIENHHKSKSSRISKYFQIINVEVTVVHLLNIAASEKGLYIFFGWLFF